MSRGGSWLRLKATMTDDKASAAIKKLRKKVENISPLLSDIGTAYKNAVLRRFVAEVDPDGRAWADLSDVTIKHKKSHGSVLGPYKKGVFKGNLFANIRSRTYKNEVVVGSNVVYAKRFNYGYPKPYQPPRPFIGFDEQTNLLVLKALKRQFKIR